MTRGVVAFSAAVLVLALASSVDATIVTDFAQLDTIFGGQFKGHYRGGATVSFVYTDPGTHQSPQCLSTPASVPGDALFVLNTCNGPDVMTMDDAREVSFTAGSQTVGRASDERGSASFVSYDTTNGLFKMGENGFNVCMRVFPDPTNGNAPVFFALHNHNTDIDVDECAISSWLDSTYPLSASASSWCDFSNMRSVDKSAPTFTTCPATGTCEIASDCITALPADACKAYTCTDFGLTKACTSTNKMDGTICDFSAGGLCESGTCQNYDGSTYPSFLSDGYIATPSFTYTMDSSGANPECITAATPVSAGQPSAAQYMQACDPPAGSNGMPGKVISLPQAQADTSGSLATTHPGRTFPLPPDANWNFRHYDSSSGLMKVAMCPSGDNVMVCPIRCVLVGDYGGNVGFLYHSLESGSTFDTCLRDNYPSNPGDMSSWNAKCSDGSAFMNGYNFAPSGTCGGGGSGDSGSSSQCAMGSDIFYWQDLIISSQCDDNKYPCQPMTMPNGEPGFVLGHKDSVLGSGMPAVEQCSSCSTSLCPSE